MKVFIEIAEAMERLEELIDLAARGDEILICRDGNPIAGLTAIGKTMDTWDERSWPRVAKAFRSEPPPTTTIFMMSMDCRNECCRSPLP